MKVLVTVASKYGATADIARGIGDTLTAEGVDVTVIPPEDAPAADGFDAVVIGSSVYAGHWLNPAKDFVERNAEALASRPVWLFSSGPLGEPPMPDEVPVDATKMIEATGAREHRLFPGKLDRSNLSFGEKAIVMALRAPEGDYRDWNDIHAWAATIGTSL